MLLLICSFGISTSEISNDAVQIENHIVCYKGIIMLNRDCNLAFGRIFFPYLKLSLSIFFIVTLFACIRLLHRLDFMTSVTMVLLVVAILTLLFPISIILSNMYDTSKDFSQNLSSCICNVSNIRTKKVLTRMLKSCDVIRTQVGNFYHMEAKAKLTMLSNIVNGVVFSLVNVEM